MPPYVDVKCCKKTGWTDYQVIMMIQEWVQSHSQDPKPVEMIVKDSSLPTDDLDTRLSKVFLRIYFNDDQLAVQFKLTFPDILFHSTLD